MTRRWFTSVLTASSLQRIRGANDRIGVALIGSGRRGRSVMRSFLATNAASLRVLCDIYEVQRDRARTMLDQSPLELHAYEEAVQRSGVDAVIIATPDHHHLEMATAALRAGKHVYLEKPATHHLDEGAGLLREVRASGKICQIGTQQRSGAHYRRVREEFFDSGKLGRVILVRALWHNFPWPARAIPLSAKPGGLDWLRFLGNTPYHEYDAARYDSWRHFPEYGGGVLSDILNHWADVAQWMMNDANPLAAVSFGGIRSLQDGRVNPDTVSAIVQYKDWNLNFESTVLPIRDHRPGVLFEGTEGSLFLARDGYIYTPVRGNPVEVMAQEDLDRAHAQDFIDAIRQRRMPSADIGIALEGLRPCHLARAAYWSAKRARYDTGRNQIVLD